MRVTFVLPAFNMSGGTRVVAIHAEALWKRGHEVLAIAPAAKRQPLVQKVKAVLRGKGWPRPATLPKSYFDGLGLACHELDEWRPIIDKDVPDGDVVVATWWETAEWVNALSPTKGAKVYFIQHHEVFPYLPIARARATYRFPLHKIVVADWLKDVMRTEYGEQVVDVVPNSVDHTQFFASERGKQSLPTVGFLYSTVPFKGLDVALAAIESVAQRFPNLRTISFGSQSPSGVHALPLHTDFVFCPPQDEIRTLYSRCDVWISASRSEGFNLPAMEAMACRTPVVATQTGWPAESLNTGQNGVLAQVDDVTGLAQGMEWVLSLPDPEWRRLSLNAYNTVAASSWRDSAKKFERALENACYRALRNEIAGRCHSQRPAASHSA